VSLTSLFFPPLRERNGALYRSRRQATEWLKMGVVCVAGVAVMALGGLWGMGTVYLAVGAFLGWRLWKEHQRFGPLGAPVLRITADEALFVIPSPIMPRTEVVDLRGVKSLTLQGDAWRRTFIFERKHGDALRITMSYGRHDEAVLAYVHRVMPARIPVRVQPAAH
jgi:hypothetical protein